jgi:hypothetical protein
MTARDHLPVGAEQQPSNRRRRFEGGRGRAVILEQRRHSFSPSSLMHEHTQLLARLLNEVAAARAAITSSYLRLWRSDAGSPGHTSDHEPPDRGRDSDAGAVRDTRSPPDAN